MKDISDKLKILREERGLGLRTLARLAKVDPAQLSKIENGKEPVSDDFLKKLASVKELGITYNQLMAWKLIGEVGNDVVLEAFIELYPHLTSTVRAEALRQTEVSKQETAVIVEGSMAKVGGSTSIEGVKPAAKVYQFKQPVYFEWISEDIVEDPTDPSDYSVYDRQVVKVRKQNHLSEEGDLMLIQNEEGVVEIRHLHKKDLGGGVKILGKVMGVVGDLDPVWDSLYH